MANSIKEIIQKEYEILAGIAEGGEAKIYKVKNKKYDYIRAIRFYNSPIESDSAEDKTYKYFINECKILLRLGNGVHPHIIRIAEPKIIGAHPVYEMDYLEGSDLATRLETEKCFDVRSMLKMLAEISSALAYCHYDVYKYSINPDDPEDYPYIFKDENKKWVTKKGAEAVLVNRYKVVHNDIHSRNIFAKNDGNFILLDFGLSFVGDKVSRMTRQKGGIYEYMAPEKFDDVALTEQSDIYSFGIVLFECLTGKLPYLLKNAKNPSMSDINTVSEAHKNSPIPDLWEIRKATLKSKGQPTTEKDYPDWLEVIIRKCLAKKPQDRYQNGKELHLAVTKALENQAKTEQQRLLEKELAVKEEAEQIRIQGYRNQIRNLEAEIITLRYQQDKTNNETIDVYKTQIVSLENNIENAKKRLDTKTQELTNSTNLVRAGEQINQGLTTQIQTFKNEITTLKQKINRIENRPATEKIVEKIVTILPEAAKKEIEKIKSQTLRQLVGVGVVTALLAGGIGWTVKQPKTRYVITDPIQAIDTTVKTNPIPAIDTTTTADPAEEPSLAQCEEILNAYERNIQGSDVPDQTTIDQHVGIVQAYPQLKDRAYRIYYNEAIRLKNLSPTTSEEFMAIAKKLNGL